MFTGSEQAKKYHSITFFPYEDDRAKLESNLFADLSLLASNGSMPSLNSKYINTWDDWHLIPTSRPVVNPPQPKTNIVEVPGSSISLDISDALTSYPTYKDRTGNFSFYVENGYKEWNDMYSIVMAFLHGRRMRFILNDDPGFFYEGRLSVDSWASNKERSTIVISYTLNAYKKDIFSSTEPVLWDLFDLENGIDLGPMFSGGYNEDGVPLGIDVNKPILSYTTRPGDPSNWKTIFEYGLTNSFTQKSIDIMPVNPVFNIYMNNTSGLHVFLYNPEVKDYSSAVGDPSVAIKVIGKDVSGRYQYIRDPELVLSGFSSGSPMAIGSNSMQLWFQGNGNVTIIFRRGRL